MKTKQLLRLIKIVTENQINELEISGWGQHLRITKVAPQSRHIIDMKDANLAAQGQDGMTISHENDKKHSCTR